jgi:hypothetical protein
VARVAPDKLIPHQPATNPEAWQWVDHGVGAAYRASPLQEQYTMSDEPVRIPREFWGPSLTKDEFNEIVETSCLNAEQCARVWRMLDRQDPPPDGMKILIKQEDLMRVFPEITPRRST